LREGDPQSGAALAAKTRVALNALCAQNISPVAARSLSALSNAHGYASRCARTAQAAARVANDGRIADAGKGRHAEVLHEALRDDIRMPAGGFATISVRLDPMQR
jgi:hypothetical protein